MTAALYNYKYKLSRNIHRRHKRIEKSPVLDSKYIKVTDDHAKISETTETFGNKIMEFS